MSILKPLICVIALSAPVIGWAVEIPLIGPEYFHEAETRLQGGPKVSRANALITVTLNNGCRIALDTEQNRLDVRNENNVAILANDPGRILKLTYLPAGMGEGVVPIEGNVKVRFDRVGCFGEAVTFYFVLLSEDSKESRLEWTFLPQQREINGKRFNGVGDTFLVEDTHHYLHKLSLYGLAATGDDFKGSRSFRLACYSGNEHGYKEVTFGNTRQNLGWWGAFIDGGQFFHLVGQKQGTLYEYLDDECHDMTLLGSNGGNTAVEITHTLLLGRIPSLYRTPMRVRLFTDVPLTPQLWMELARSRRDYFRQKYEILPTPLRPIFVDRNWWHQTPFEEYAKTKLPLIRELGFRRMEMGWVYKRGVAPARGHAWVSEAKIGPTGQPMDWGSTQTEYKDVLTEEYGGAPAIKGFIDQAHGLGIEVYFWHQMAHGWRGSEDVRNHPDWVVHSASGKIVGGSYEHCLAYFDLRSGFQASTLERIARIKRNTGVDGFWLDMYGSGLHQSPNYIHLVAPPAITERMDYVRTMRALGLGLYGEGISTVAIDSFEMLAHPNWIGKEFILYGTSPFVWRTEFFDTLDLFKLLSYQCLPTGPATLPPSADAVTQKRLDTIRYRNRCFNLIEDNLGQPIGITEAPGGTQWTHVKGNALFFHSGTNAVIRLRQPSSKVLAIGPAGNIPVTVNTGAVTISMPANSVMIIVSGP